MGQPVIVDGDLDLHTGRHVFTDDAQHLADSLAFVGGLLDDVDLDDLAMLGALESVAGYQDVLGDALVVRDHERDTTLDEQPAYQDSVSAFDHADDHALLATATIDTGELHHRLVTVQHGAHLLGREEEIVPAFVRDEEAVTVRVRGDAAQRQVGGVDRQEAAAAVLHQLAIAQHGSHSETHRLLLLAVTDLELVDQLIEGHGALLLDDLEDQLAAGDGVLVALGFASGVGVGDQSGLLALLASGRLFSDLATALGLHGSRGFGLLLASGFLLRGPGFVLLLGRCHLGDLLWDGLF